MVSVPYRVLAGAALLATVGAGGYWRGHVAADRECEAVRQAEALAYAEQYQLEVERGNLLAKEYEEARRVARDKTRALAGAADRLEPCGAVGRGLVRLHDSAANEAGVSFATTESACAPSTVTADQFGRVLVENYGACHEYRAQLNALIDWHEGR